MTNQQPARSAHTSPSQPPPARPGQPSTYPTQGQHPSPAHSRPAPEDSRGTPAPKRKDRGRQQHQSPRPTPRRERKQGKGETSGQRLHTEPAQEDTASRRPEDSQPQPMKPPARQQSQHHPGHRTSQTGGRGKRGEKGEGKRNGQKMTV